MYNYAREVLRIFNIVRDLNKQLPHFMYSEEITHTNKQFYFTVLYLGLNMFEPIFKDLGIYF